MTIHTATNTDDLETWAARQSCPQCAKHGLVIDWRLVARPVGSYSLAGVQMKFSAREEPWLRCPACGVEGRGH